MGNGQAWRSTKGHSRMAAGRPGPTGAATMLEPAHPSAIDPRLHGTARPGVRRLPLEQAIAVGCWILVVLSVQPWVRQPRGPQAAVSGGTDTGKGVLIAAVFVVAAALAAPGFRTRVPVFFLFYAAYLFVAAATAFHLIDPVASLLRVLRLALALGVPLLLWRWLTGDPIVFVRAHRTAHLLLGLTVFAGLAIFPSAAWDYRGSTGAGQRLQGVILPMLSPRVGEVGAIIAGLTLIGLVLGKVRRLPGLIVVGLGLALLVMSWTRTAAAAMLVSLLLAFFATRKARPGRRAFAVLLVLLLLALAARPVWTWATRGQTGVELSSFTGRTLAWSAVFEQESALRTVVLGHGLGNKRILIRRGEGDIDVQAIDNAWITMFWETGVLGVMLVLLAVIAAFVTAWRAPTPYIRAAAIFLVVYTFIASFTETGLSDLSSQTLHLMVAAGAAYADRLVTFGKPFLLPSLGSQRRAAGR
jgi:O-antigen ligase